MISLEDYTMSYELYLAENEMIESLLQYVPMVNESYGLEAISEGVIDIIIKYLDKVADGLSHVWKKFKKIFKSDKKYLESISKDIKSCTDKDCKFTITNFPRYNLKKLDSIVFQPFRYPEMKDALSSREKFIKTYYPMLDVKKGKKGIKHAVEKVVINGKKENVKCVADMIKKMYDFCYEGYQVRVDAIQHDLEAVNPSNDNIQKMVNTVITTTTESFMLIEDYLIEINERQKKKNAKNTGNPNRHATWKKTKKTMPKANQKINSNVPDGNIDNKNDDKKPEIVDDPDKEKPKDNKEEIIQMVTTFTKVSTEILTAKMNIVKDCYKLYMKIIKHTIPDKTKKDKNEQEENTNDTEQTQQETPHVEV